MVWVIIRTKTGDEKLRCQTTSVLTIFKFSAVTFLVASMKQVGWLLGFNVDAISKMIYDGRSQFKVHTDERTQVHSTRLFLAVTHPSINRGRRALTSVNEPLS
jgi:hypothetical protein